MAKMTPRQRAAYALECKIPDQVPTFELEFQLIKDFCGKDYIREKDLVKLTSAEKERKLRKYAFFLIDLFSILEYSIIPVHYLSDKNLISLVRYLKDYSGNKFMFTTHGDGTFSLPDGNGMYEFAYRIADDFDGLKTQAEKMADDAIERNKKLIDGGFDSLILCADYCYNSGPFISPDMFSELIAPYLKRIIDSIRSEGAYAIKHTDGNIMPILDQLAQCGPHALHSIDPMANVDIREVKKLIGHKVALCGNVNCALMQTGTDEEVVQSAEYAMKYGKPGGGYIFCTSNVPFEGLPLERYLLAMEVWKKNRVYETV